MPIEATGKLICKVEGYGGQHSVEHKWQLKVACFYWILYSEANTM